MRTNRRDFLKTTAAAGGALAAGVGPLALTGCAVEGDGPAPGSGAAGQSRAANPLSILILGGTGFIGPHQVEYALSRGHEVTLFNRGRTNAQLFPEVEKLVGDRNNDVAALEGRRWDAVIDDSGYTPDQVRLSVDALKDATDQYLFTSTRAVYTD